VASVRLPLPRLAVTLGDPRGIGPEVVARALHQAPLQADITVIGHADELEQVPAARRVAIGAWNQGKGDVGTLEGTAAVRAREAGAIAAAGVMQAVKLARQGEVDGIVTAPVHKHALHLAGYAYPGLTEFLSYLVDGAETAMMLATDRLRVVLVTTHLPLKEVPRAVTTERVIRTGRIAQRALRDWWAIARPRLAVCALNPHAGESGLFGDEDEAVLKPAAEALGAAGPLPADTVFVRAMSGEFDAVLAPYHDVGMTAVKVAGFGRGVNVTLGLPFPRTAPDHGTAFDIAGKGIADPGSMRAALELAAKLAARRKTLLAAGLLKSPE
jgi:4-hydroxythreonine-4-phosphate dehydrogenase